jgi:Di-haem oxidoreductase, putative peroxidase
MTRWGLVLGAVVVCALFSSSRAQIDNTPYWPPAPSDRGPAHPAIDSQDVLLQKFNSGRLTLDDMRRMGLSVFSTPFNSYDGYGDGPFDRTEINTRLLGHRPTLQGNGLVLRVNGLDAQSCNECHTIVKASNRPPTLGLAGVGGMVQNAIIMPSMIDVSDSLDGRGIYQPGHDPDLPMVFDGAADFNGRFANPPFLYGGGGVELLGKEMTTDLQSLLQVAKTSPAGTTVVLTTHGVGFGYLVSIGGGSVDLSHIEGVDADLVVKPFGRKGEFFSMRDFDRGAMQFHFGIQPVEVVGEGVDDDGDGVTNEVTVSEMTVLHFFDVTNPRPVDATGNDAKDGMGVFTKIGCAGCHIPSLTTRGRTVPLAYPEVATNPGANDYAKVDLVRVGFTPVDGAGVAVPLLADLKRHDMGDRLAESFEFGTVSNRQFTTARLWGVADTAPYLHDGRATTLYQAIWFHGGEAQGPRNAFLGLNDNQQRKLLNFLSSLHTPDHPNEELLPLP